ncbi:MAG: NifU family protein [Acidimicrobiales bacterium]
MTESLDLRAVGDRIEELLGGLRSATDGRTYEQVEDVLAAVTELYGGGLARAVELAGEDRELLDRLVADDLVGSLLVLHGLHPLSLTERVMGALDSVRPYLGSHGGDVEVLEVDEDEGVVSLRMLGSCDGCASSSVTLELAVEKAIEEAAPEITRIDVEGGSEATPPPGPGPTPVKLGPKPERTGVAWEVVYGLRALVPGRLGPSRSRAPSSSWAGSTDPVRVPQRLPELRPRPRHRHPRRAGTALRGLQSRLRHPARRSQPRRHGPAPRPTAPRRGGRRSSHRRGPMKESR